MKHLKQPQKPKPVQIRNRILTIIFVVLLFGLAAVNVAWPKQSFSENENRVLQTFPDFSWDHLISGDFTEQFDTYITDHFAFRDVWVGAKTFAEIGLLKRDSGGAYLAKDGYLIQRFDHLERDQQTGQTRYEQNLNYIKTFAESMKQNFSIDVRTMLVPTAGYVLSDKLPPFAPELDQDALIEQAKSIVPNFVDLRATLKAHKDEPIFYRTDHHWTSLGVCYAYATWCQTVGLTAHGPEWYRTETLSDQFFGTTFSKASLYTVQPDTITAFHPPQEPQISVDYNQGRKVTNTLYEPSHLDTKDKYSVFLDGNQPIITITSDNQNGRKLLIIKDSYANSFAPFTVPDYEQVILVDLRHYRASLAKLVEESGVNEILILYNVDGFSSDANLFLLTR